MRRGWLACHRDPFDRLLVSQSQIETIALISAVPIFFGPHVSNSCLFETAYPYAAGTQFTKYLNFFQVLPLILIAPPA